MMLKNFSRKTKLSRVSNSSPATTRVLAAHDPFSFFSYAWRILRRQKWFLFALLASYIATISLVTLSTKPIYRAEIAAFYNPDGNVSFNLTAPSAPANYEHLDPRFLQISESLRRKLASEDFLLEIARRHDFVPIPSKTPLSAAQVWETLRKWMGYQTKEHSLRQQWSTQDLRQQLYASADSRLSLLTITAYASSQKTAKALAEQAMEAFIASELNSEAQIAQIEFEYLRKLSVRESYLAIGTKAAKIQSNEETNNSTERPQANPTSEQAEKLQKIFEESESRIQSLRSSISAKQNAHNQRRLQLESEIGRLAALLTASHPDLIAKQEELSQLPRNADTENLERELGEAMHAQTLIRNQMRQIGTDSTSTSTWQRSHQFVDDLDWRLQQTEHSYQRLRDQATNPALRTRLRALGEATIDPKSGDERWQTLKFLLSAGLFSLPLLVILRESRDRRACDIWRIQRHCEAPVLWCADLAFVEAYGKCKRNAIRALRLAASKREHLRSLHERKDAAALNFLRQAAHLMGPGLDAEGYPTLLLTVSSNDRSADLLMSVLNLYADERPGKTLVLDFAHGDPLTEPSSDLAKHANIAGFLSGKAPWQDVRQNPNTDHAFAWVPPLNEDAIVEGTVRHLQSSTLRKLMITLAKNYQHIFVRSLPVDQPSANAELIACAGQIILICDARSATLEQIDQLVASAPREKLAGLIVIAT